MSEKLLPCPFCGSSMITPSEVFYYPDSDHYCCSSCGARADKSQWNIRTAPTPSPQDEQVTAETLTVKAPVVMLAIEHALATERARIRAAVEGLRQRLPSPSERSTLLSPGTWLESQRAADRYNEVLDDVLKVIEGDK